MTTQRTESHESAEAETESDVRAEKIASNIAARGPSGSIIVGAGGVVLARAIWSQRRMRAFGHALIGTALVGFGLWKRQSGRGQSTDGIGTEPTGEMGTVEERIDSQQTDVNPRGTADEPDVGTETEPDEGAVRFTDSQTDQRASGTLDEPAPDDPRIDEEDVTEVDISEASMADEASEATGPAPEQGQPAQTESTEPEPTPQEDTAAGRADSGPNSDDETTALDDENETTALDSEDGATTTDESSRSDEEENGME